MFSPDMFQLHIFLWQHIKENIYAAEVQYYDDRLSCILVAGTYIRCRLRQVICVKDCILCRHEVGM